MREVITCVHPPRTRAELEEFLRCFDSGDFSPVMRKKERELEIYYILGLFLPLAWGVWEGKIPVLGGIQHDLFTRLFVFVLGFGISVSIMVLFDIILAKYYIGNLTRRAVDALVWGRAVSLTFKGILIFGLIYIALLFWTPENVWWGSRTYLDWQSGSFLLQGYGDEVSRMDERLDAAFNLTHIECYSLWVS